MRRPTQADHLAAAVDSWQAIRRLHDRGATLIDKLPDAEAARQLDDLLCIIGAHVAAAREALADAVAGCRRSDLNASFSRSESEGRRRQNDNSRQPGRPMGDRIPG